MADAPRADPAEIQDVLQRSRALWGGYVDAAKKDKRLPAECGVLRNVLGRVPKFPGRVVEDEGGGMSELRYDNEWSFLQICGTSTWRTSSADCDLPAKTMSLQLICGIQHPNVCTLDAQSDFANWPGVQGRDEHAREGNHLAVLILAWAYILSARWAELQSPPPNASDTSENLGMQYAAAQATRVANKEDIPADVIAIDPGQTNEHAARWWAAILAPGEGWQATMQFDTNIYRSPWSAHLARGQDLILLRQLPCKPTDTPRTLVDKSPELPPSPQEALSYLQLYCEYHSIGSQCMPALAASLFLPWQAEFGLPLSIPKFKPSQSNVSTQSSQPSTMDLGDELALLPYYMTLSSYHRGIRAALHGSFFNAAIPCNLVSAWLYLIWEIMEPLVIDGGVTKIASIMCKRQPSLAALWLDALAMGLGKGFAGWPHSSTIVELHFAAWTKTIHSFILLPTRTSYAIEKGEVTRADEARLLYLTTRPRPPICPWQPFGSSPLECVDLEVLEHIPCGNHDLLYENWAWETEGGPSHEDRGFEDVAVEKYWDGTADWAGIIFNPLEEPIEFSD
ncbi:MAG: hypothetical protein Q9212_004494 [Teloschistes hypoglaucus]